MGETYFDGKESDSLGKLTKEEWNNLFYKHLEHHLNQFGVYLLRLNLDDFILKK